MLLWNSVFVVNISEVSDKIPDFWMTNPGIKHKTIQDPTAVLGNVQRRVIL